MKPRLHYTTTFNLRFMGAMSLVSLVLQPIIVKAEPIKDIQIQTQTSGNLFSTTSLPVEIDIANQYKSKEQMNISNATITPSVKATDIKIQPFQPATNMQLPRGLRKIAAVAEDKEKIPPPTSPSQRSPTSTAVKILTPTASSIVDVAATTVIVQFPIGSQVELRVNGELVDPSLVGRMESDASTNLLTQTWYGVPLKQGDNTISAQVVGGTELPVTVRIAVRRAPQQLTVETVESQIPADGRSTATIRGQLVDANSNRSNRDAVVTLIPSAGELVGVDFKPDQPGFQVEARNGQFTATLRSHLKAQTVRIRAIANDLEAFTQLQLETALRPSLVTGVVDLRLGARGTDYYGSFRDFLRPDRDNRTQLDFHSAVFATGAIGEWLFTGAYNSSRSLNEDCNCDNRLFKTYQFSEQNYPVYGDSSKVDAVAASIDSVFLRFERSTGIPGAAPDYAMWGDYNTEEFARLSQQFTSITRQLHGFKANYNLGNLQITGFYGNHLEGFQRDTIAPDGTSGYYFLSRRLLQPGSENVFIELEELNRPGTVLERKQLNRGPDYDIDYDRGTLLFREPLLRTDIDQTGQVLVRRLVVSYQYDSQDSDSNIYAGRLQYNLSRNLNHESWLGATYIQEKQGVRDFQLYGADALIALGDKSKLIAEYAHSTNDSEFIRVSGDAYRLEAEGQIANGIQGRAYYRFADTGFANNATISFVPGQTRYGAQVTGKLTSSTNVRVQYDHEDNFGIAPQPLDTFEELFSPRSEAIPGSKVDNSLTTITAGIQQRLGSATVDVDWIHRYREDRISSNALTSNSDQLRSRFTVPIVNNLTFQAQNELTLSADADSVYPDRTVLGLNWAVIPGVNVSLAQQFYTRGQLSGNSITSLNINGEHQLGPDTTLTGRYSILGGANEMTTQGAIGLNNRWSIAPGLRLNLAYEHVFGSFFGRTATGQQFAQPYAFGQAASAIAFNGGDSYSIGLEYSDNPQFQTSARYEHRTSSGGSNTVISAAATGKISPAITALVRYQQANSSNQKLTGLLGDRVNLKLGLAYRDPNDDQFNALLRYEYRQNPDVIPDTILLGSGTGSEDHTFALEAIYAPNWQWEFYGKYALRNSTSYLANDLAGTSMVNLAQIRATYRLGYSMDLVGEARWIGQANYTETGFVVETGYYLTPNLRLSAGYVFGQVDDRDFSGTRSAGGPYLGLTVKLNELFDGFGQQKPVPRQQQQPKTTEG
ncbi:TonB-dependent receptor [aff. Roholtiella sp. LEGE 12411]|uniref:TonB-dependent receptor n=1 Tax=aff. Roholtiella sp. LEGE 12411 TaxID=1828822 RepID=UPI00187DEBBE|nr:TonB-dependent receptor [aff. Roholtiella sp. LEGE 12411]MBE9036746.1 TonB-dependent receptor [aff. Roholtiella sp. LEGE 12411]